MGGVLGGWWLAGEEGSESELGLTYEAKIVNIYVYIYIHIYVYICNKNNPEDTRI